MKVSIEQFEGEAKRTVNTYLAPSFRRTSCILSPCACVLLENTHSLAYWEPELNDKTIGKVLGNRQILIGESIT